MIISTCGFGSTGSSAVTDYLSECDNVNVFDNIEFDIAMGVDGLCDLEYHLMQYSSKVFSGIFALQRFKKKVDERTNYWVANTQLSKSEIRELTESYLDQITMVKYFCSGNPFINKIALSRFLRKKIGISIILNRLVLGLEKRGVLKKIYRGYPLEITSASVRPQNFYEASRNYVRTLMNGMGVDFSKIVAADQLFAGNDPVRSFPFFDDPYAIVVDRDPRDVYIFAKEKLLSRGNFMPVDSVDDFIIYYKMLRDGQPYKETNDRVLNLRFEEMVYDYEHTADQIDAFLGIKNQHRQTIFIPSMSAANTNLIRKYPQYSSEVQKIEESLPDYIFHFENYNPIQDDGIIFYGKSLKNR